MRYLLLEKSSSSNIACVSEICLLFISWWFENLANLAIWVLDEAMKPMWQNGIAMWAVHSTDRKKSKSPNERIFNNIHI